MISFMLNDQQIDITESKADLTLLNYLRDQKRLTGTKEGCASGDCGACTVAVAEVNASGNTLDYKAINSCVTFLSAIHGKHLITVEHLQEGKDLHPVQQSMLDSHGSQCGFCTPGFVMSMFAYYHQNRDVSLGSIEQALSGNLCRCTGYRPIIDATLASCSNKSADKFDRNEATMVNQLNNLSAQPAGIPGLYIPKTREELRDLREAFPEARLVAGSTDLALEVTQQLNDLNEMISLAHIPELTQLNEAEDGLVIGSAITLSDAEDTLLTTFPELSELLWRFASRPIRNQATFGGNVANASPIGDFPPALLALNASIMLDNGVVKREIPANRFFTGYRQTELAPDEWIEAIKIPHRSAQSVLRAYKISKRQEDDISAVCAVFCLELKEGQVEYIRSGFGGVAATPTEAQQLNQLLKGKLWSDKQTMQLAKSYLSSCFTPIDDVRASAEYRNTMVANLWHRFWLETSQQSIAIKTRVADHA